MILLFNMTQNLISKRSRSMEKAKETFSEQNNLTKNRGLFKKGVSLHSQPKVKFRQYFVHFLMRQKSLKN